MYARMLFYDLIASDIFVVAPVRKQARNGCIESLVSGLAWKVTNRGTSFTIVTLHWHMMCG